MKLKDVQKYNKKTVVVSARVTGSESVFITKNKIDLSRLIKISIRRLGYKDKKSLNVE